MLALLAAVGAVLCFSMVPVFLRHFAKLLDFWTVNGVRYTTGALFWLPYVIASMRRPRQPRPVEDGKVPAPLEGPFPRGHRWVWLYALIPAAVNIVGQVGWGLAPYYNSAPTIGFAIRSAFLFTALLGFAFIPAERAVARRPTFYYGAVVCALGLMLMFAEPLLGRQPSGHERTSVPGMLILLWVAVCWGGYAVSVRIFMAGFPIRLAFGVVSLYTAAGLVTLMFLRGDYRQLGNLAVVNLILLVVSGVIGIAFGHVFHYRAIHGLGPVIASGMQLACPFVISAAAWVFLGETMTGLQLLGGMTILAGGYLLVRAKALADARAQPRP